MEASCEYIEYAVVDNQQGVVFQFGGWASDSQLLAVKNKLVMKCHKGSWVWILWIGTSKGLL
jgi:hypothetical protein